MKQIRKQDHSLTVWINAILVGIVAVLVAIMLLFSYLSIRTLREREREKEQDLLNLSVQNIDTKLDGTEMLLYQIFRNRDDITLLETSDHETRRFLARQNIINSLKDIISWNDMAEFLFYWCPLEGRETFLRVSGGNADVNQLDALQAEIQTRIAESGASRGSFLAVTENGTGCYMRYFKIRNSYAGMCVTTDAVLGDLIWMSELSGSGVFLADDNGTVYSRTPGFPARVDYAIDGAQAVHEHQRYLQLSAPSSTRDFTIGSWTNMRLIRQQLRTAEILTVAFSLLVFVILALASVALVRAFMRPVLGMAQDMKQLGNGEWGVRAPTEGPVREFNQLTRNFNEMVGEIRDLKIANYEKELDAQKATLHYLQMQINPHFYLNVLNIIYSLAEIRDYEKIQQMTLALVEYSRYTFRDPQTLVTVQEEIEHVENYLRIQQMRFPGRIEYRSAISPEVEDALIPPFIVQSFVENSIKYGVKMDRHNVIQVSGRIVEIGEDLSVQLEIHDNGDGYSETVLEEMHADGWSPDNKGRFIGINNAMKRLEVTFGSKATLLLKNEDGARTVLIIPLFWREEDEHEAL